MEVPAVTPQEGLLETSNLERKPRAKDWARARDLGSWKAGRRQAQPPDAATSAHPGGQHIALVKLPVSDLPGGAERRVTVAATEHSPLT